MSVAGYTTAVEARPRGDLALWLEIEGLPYAYGTVAKDSSWFSGRAAASRFLGIRSWFAKDSLPSLPPQTLDHLEGAVGGGALSVQIVDVDGSLTELTASARTDGRCVFASTLDNNDTGAKTVTGDTTTWPASGAAFVGYETITYTSTTTTSVTIASRGAYRSRATSHAGGVVSPGTASNGSSRIDVGELLTPYPTKLEGRRVWLMAGHSPASDADCTEVWSGVIEEVSFGGPDLRTLSLSCSQSFGELNQPAFGDLGTFGIPEREGIAPSWIIASRTQTNGPGTMTPGEAYQFGAVPVLRAFMPRVTSADDEAADKRRYFLADEGSGMDVLRMDDDFGTTGATVNVYQDWYLRFTGAPTRVRNPGGSLGSFIYECAYLAAGSLQLPAGAHPLQVLLQCLLSDDGDLTNDATYDTLPSKWGLGLKPDRVDVAGIEDMIAATPDLRVQMIVAKPVEKFGEWARTHLLKPFGFFLRPSLGNLLSVGRLQSPTPDALTGAVAISRDDVVALGGWSSDALSVIGTVVWQSGALFDREEGEAVPAESITNRLQDNGRIVAIDYPKAGTVDVNGMAIPTTWDDSPRAMLDYCGRVAARFAQPVATLDLTVTFKHIVREVGDFVSLTHDVVPSRLSATRGVSSQVWEVVGKTADFKRMTVGLTLRQTSITDLDTRYLAPAMAVVSVAGLDVTVSAGGYVANTIKTTAAFAVGDKVRGYSALPMDLYNRTTVRTITALSSSPAVVTLDDVTGIALGTVLIHADYADWDVSTSTAAASLAFRANVSATLNGDAPAEMA